VLKSGLTLLLVAPGSLTNIMYLCSSDATNWSDMVGALTNPPVPLTHLWLVFPTNSTPAVPEVREVMPQ